MKKIAANFFLYIEITETVDPFRYILESNESVTYIRSDNKKIIKKNNYN